MLVIPHWFLALVWLHLSHVRCWLYCRLQGYLDHIRILLGNHNLLQNSSLEYLFLRESGFMYCWLRQIEIKYGAKSQNKQRTKSKVEKMRLSEESPEQNDQIKMVLSLILFWFASLNGRLHHSACNLWIRKLQLWSDLHQQLQTTWASDQVANQQSVIDPC